MFDDCVLNVFFVTRRKPSLKGVEEGVGAAQTDGDGCLCLKPDQA